MVVVETDLLADVLVEDALWTVVVVDIVFVLEDGALVSVVVLIVFRNYMVTCLTHCSSSGITFGNHLGLWTGAIFVVETVLADVLVEDALWTVVVVDIAFVLEDGALVSVVVLIVFRYYMVTCLTHCSSSGITFGNHLGLWAGAIVVEETDLLPDILEEDALWTVVVVDIAFVLEDGALVSVVVLIVFRNYMVTCLTHCSSSGITFGNHLGLWAGAKVVVKTVLADVLVEDALWTVVVVDIAFVLEDGALASVVVLIIFRNYMVTCLTHCSSSGITFGNHLGLWAGAIVVETDLLADILEEDALWTVVVVDIAFVLEDGALVSVVVLIVFRNYMVTCLTHCSSSGITFGNHLGLWAGAKVVVETVLADVLVEDALWTVVVVDIAFVLEDGALASVVVLIIFRNYMVTCLTHCSSSGITFGNHLGLWVGAIVVVETVLADVLVEDALWTVVVVDIAFVLEDGALVSVVVLIIFRNYMVTCLTHCSSSGITFGNHLGLWAGAIVVVETDLLGDVLEEDALWTMVVVNVAAVVDEDAPGTVVVLTEEEALDTEVVVGTNLCVLVTQIFNINDMITLFEPSSSSILKEGDKTFLWAGTIVLVGTEVVAVVLEEDALCTVEVVIDLAVVLEEEDILLTVVFCLVDLADVL
jgi:hypothetical protein